MLPNDRAQPAAPDKPSWGARLLHAYRQYPLWVKVVIAIAAIPFAELILLAALVYGIVAVTQGRRTVGASIAVALWGLTVFSFAYKDNRTWLYSVILLPFAVVLAAHAKPLARSFVPCRTVAWVLAWSVPAGVIAFKAAPGQPFVGTIAAWLLAAAVLGWRVAKSIQDARMYGRGSWERPGGKRASSSGGSARRPSGLCDPRCPGAGRGAALRRARRPRPPGRYPPAAAPDLGRGRDGRARRDDRPDPGQGAGPLDRRLHRGGAAAHGGRHQHRAADAALRLPRPARHRQDDRGPGAGQDLLRLRPAADARRSIEAHRADLVGEYLGATAIKTNELVDSALGGVLFIDEAYSLVNEGDGQADRFGQEAVQALLKRAEDNRDNLIIILAGYEKQMESFLSSNPGLASRFATRLKFPSYSPNEMMALAQAAIERRGERLDADARPVLYRKFEEIGRRRIADDLGNGRFVRSLIEKAGQARDVRVITSTTNSAEQDLLTIRAGDLEQGYAELTSRLRGYEDTPTVEGALAELDWLVGLDPVKQQVRAIAAQLRVAKMRSRQGLSSQPPARHFVFTGPPGTGKTTVSRILGRIFAAHGLLVRPEVIEAHRADLVGEHLGSTAIKTGKLIDSAMGGVLFIDEAYSLNNAGYDGGDAFGSEAVQTLLKRAEDDRDRLVIVLAGYPDDMDRFLRSNPGLASRFSTRVTFPSYSPNELVEISGRLAKGADDWFDPAALEVLRAIFAQACAEGRIDELGNGRFARSLYERACACRDLRVENLADPSRDDLITLTAADVQAAYGELDHGTASRPMAVPDQN